MGGRGELVGGDRVALVIERDHDRAADGRGVAGQVLAEERSCLEAVVGAHGVGPEGELGEGGAAAGLPAAAPGRGEHGDAVAVGIQGLGCDFAAGSDDLAAFGHPALEGVADVSEAVSFVAGEGLVAVGVEVVDRDVLAAVDLGLVALDDGGHIAVKAALGLGLDDIVNNRQCVLVLRDLFDDLFGCLFGCLFGDLFGDLFDDLFVDVFDDFFYDLFFILCIGIDAAGGESDGKEHGQDQDHGQCTSHFLHW